MIERLLVFAKAPIPGQVKTRLIPPLGAQQAAALHRSLVKRTVEVAISAGRPITLCAAPDTSSPFFQGLAATYALTLAAQQGTDLGARMHTALDEALADSQRVVIIGSDCPTLTADDLHQAFTALSQEAEVVLGPAEDGGYWLIGARRPAPTLFTGMAWGTEAVLAQTREQLRQLGWPWRELKHRWDLDRAEDLARLQALGGSPWSPEPPPSRSASADGG